MIQRHRPTKQEYEEIIRSSIQSDTNREQVVTLSWATHQLDELYHDLEETVDGTIWCDLDDDLAVKQADVSVAKRVIDELIGQLMTLSRELDNIRTVPE